MDKENFRRIFVRFTINLKQTPTHTSNNISKIKLPTAIQTTAPVVRPVELPVGGKLVVEVIVSLWVVIVPGGSDLFVIPVGSWVLPSLVVGGGLTVVTMGTLVVTLGTGAAVVGG